MRTQSLRQSYTRLAVVLITVIFLGVCALWAVAVQHMVPDICRPDARNIPVNVGPVHCPSPHPAGGRFRD